MQLSTCVKNMLMLSAENEYGLHGMQSEVNNYFVKVTKEIRNKTKVINPISNKHFYYVWQLPLKQQSKVYFFGESLDLWKFEGKRNTTQMICKKDRNVQGCHVIIDKTCLPLSDVLQAIPNLKQTISVLYIHFPFVVHDYAWKDSLSHVVKIDSITKHIEINNSIVLPTTVARD